MDAAERHIAITRSARYYTLGEPAAARELWLVCHGYGQLAGRFIRHFEPIITSGRAVIAPEGLHRFYLDPPDRPSADRRVGATWMTREDREADIADYIAYLDAVLAAAGRTPAQRVIALGFSQGTATVARWAAATSTPPQRLILWGSGFPSDYDWSAHEERIRTITVQVVIGDQDEFATPARVTEHEQVLRAAGVAAEIIRFAGGHRMDAAALARVAT